MRKNKLVTIWLLVSPIFLLVACTDQSKTVSLTASDYPESGSEQAVLYLTKCGECHAAPLPKIHAAEEWPGVVQRMQFRMTSKAMPALNKQDIASIVDYLQRHAKKNQ